MLIYNLKNSFLIKKKTKKSFTQKVYLIIFFFTILLSLLFSYVQFSIANHVSANSSAFKITIKTNNPGVTGPNQFEIPTAGPWPYNYNVDCNGDGVNEFTGQTGNVTCTYATPGTYQIWISGTFPRIYFYNTGDRLKLLSIDQWGSIVWRSMLSAFQGAANMVLNATDVPNLTNVTNMGAMFSGCTSLTTNPAMNSWNTQNVQYMYYMFYGATSFNQPIGNWNTQNVQNMSGMFQGATSFNQPIGNWNTQNVKYIYDMFRGATSFNQPIGNWNTQNVQNMSGMFQGATSFNQPIGNWNTQNVQYMTDMFNGATSFNQPIGNWNTQNVQSMAGMFMGATAFNQPIGTWNITNVTNMSNMLNNSGIDISNYDSILIGWSAQSIKPNVSLGAAGRQFCNSATQRAILINAPNNWNIIGDSYKCSNVANTNPKGMFDTVDCNNFIGWACDPDNFNQPLQINIYADGIPGVGSLVASGQANLQRETNIGNECGGNRNVGFRIPFPNSMRQTGNRNFFVEAINIGNGQNVTLNGSPRLFNTNSCQVNNPLGAFESVTCTYVSGWSCDLDNPSSPVTIRVYVDGPPGRGTLVATGQADLEREQAVGNICGGNRFKGFIIPIPSYLYNSGNRNFYIEAVNIGPTGSNTPELMGSPKTLNTNSCSINSQNLQCYRCNPYIDLNQDAYFSTYGNFNKITNGINRNSFIGYNLQNYPIYYLDGSNSFYEYTKNIASRKYTILEINLNTNSIGSTDLNTMKSTKPDMLPFLNLSSVLPPPQNGNIIGQINSPLNFTGNILCDVNALIFVNGDINFYVYNFVSRNINTTCNFISKGKITINSPISNVEPASTLPKYNQISALLMSDGGIDINLETPQTVEQFSILDARGIIIRGALISKKDIKLFGRLDNEPNQNSLRPAFVVEYDPRFREFLRNTIGYKKYRILE